MTQEELDNIQVTLKLPVVIINIALEALSELPYKTASGTINAILEQTEPQIKAYQVASLKKKESEEAEASEEKGEEASEEKREFDPEDIG